MAIMSIGIAAKLLCRRDTVDNKWQYWQIVIAVVKDGSTTGYLHQGLILAFDYNTPAFNAGSPEYDYLGTGNYIITKYVH